MCKLKLINSVLDSFYQLSVRQTVKIYNHCIGEIHKRGKTGQHIS